MSQQFKICYLSISRIGQAKQWRILARTPVEHSNYYRPVHDSCEMQLEKVIVTTVTQYSDNFFSQRQRAVLPWHLKNKFLLFYLTPLIFNDLGKFKAANFSSEAQMTLIVIFSAHASGHKCVRGAGAVQCSDKKWAITSSSPNELQLHQRTTLTQTPSVRRGSKK